MPQVGIDPPTQSHASYEAGALPPSHHGWICVIELSMSQMSGTIFLTGPLVVKSEKMLTLKFHFIFWR